jgi:hypothetical protein
MVIQKAVQSQPKIFRNEIFKNVVMGSTSTFRHIDLLKYTKDLFEEADFYKGTDLDHEYMVTKFIPNLIKLFEDGIKSEDSKDKGASFIIGVKNKLFEIQNDYSVLEPTDGYASVSCGYDIAMGSLYSTKNLKMSIPDKIRIALESAEHVCRTCMQNMYAEHVSCGVQRPFKIISTKDDKEIDIT